jgi:hypothetical protein
MTRFRYWLADIISGGELTRRATALEKSIAYADAGWDNSNRFARRCDKYRTALTRIAAEAKPTSNAKARRIVSIAQEALK